MFKGNLIYQFDFFVLLAMQNLYIINFINIWVVLGSSYWGFPPTLKIVLPTYLLFKQNSLFLKTFFIDNSILKKYLVISSCYFTTFPIAIKNSVTHNNNRVAKKVCIF